MSEQLPPGPGIAVLVISVPGSVGPPTDTPAAMIAWLHRHGAPRTGEVLRRLERHGWTIEPADPAAATQAVLWASAHFADVEQARAAARPFQGRINDRMRWRPAERPAALVPVAEPKALTRHGGSDSPRAPPDAHRQDDQRRDGTLVGSHGARYGGSKGAPALLRVAHSDSERTANACRNQRVAGVHARADLAPVLRRRARVQPQRPRDFACQTT